MSSQDEFSPGSASSDERKFLARSSVSAFVGRAQESEALVAGFTPALQGHGQVFLICGEPGIGKTRIADEISDLARARGMRVLWGRCWEAGDSPPYWPWIEVLRECIGDRTPDSALDPVAILGIARQAHTIKLHGLDRKDVGEFVRASGGRGLGEEALEVLYRTTGGNPFFLNETLRLVLAEQNLANISAESIKKIVIPDTVRAAIRRRIELVPAAVQDALRIGAAIGVEFDLALLQLVLEPKTASLLDIVGH